MKIDDASGKPGLTALPPAAGAALRATDKPAAVMPGTDKVSISATTRALASPQASDAAVPFDAARVDAIRMAISAGQFKIKPDNIADGLIESVRNLLGRARDGQ